MAFRGSGTATSAIAGVEDGQPDNLVALISDDHVLVRQFTVGRMARLLEIDVVDTRICQPKSVSNRLTVTITQVGDYLTHQPCDCAGPEERVVSPIAPLVSFLSLRQYLR